MTIQNTDQYVVESNGTDFSVESQDVDQKVQDDDLFVVCRSGTPYKATYAEVKESMVVPAPPTVETVSLIESDPEGDRFTSQSFVASSQIFDGEPISTKTIDAHVDGTLSRQVKFTEPLESSEITTVIRSTQLWPLGGNMTNPAGMFDNNPNTHAVPEATYRFWWNGSDPSLGANPNLNIANVKELKLGFNGISSIPIALEVYIGSGGSAQNIQTNPVTSDFYTLTAASLGLESFTLQWVQFSSSDGTARPRVSSVTINGNPVLNDSNTTNLTFANGTNMEALAAGDTVNQTANFTEPLESSGSSVVNYTSRITASNGFNPTYPPENAFDGDNTTRCLTNNANQSLTFDATGLGYKDCRVRIQTDSLQGAVSVTDSTGATWTYKVIPGEANPYDPALGFYGYEANITGEVGTIVVQGQGGNAGTIVWIQFDDEQPLENGFEETLTFANGTDMSALVAGDAVSQAGGPNYKERTNYNDGAITLTEPEIDKFFDGDIDTYMVSLAGAWTAGGGNINIDLSTAPITDVKEVKFSFNKALLDNGAMTPTLIYNSTSQGSIINMPRVDTGTHYVTTFTPGNAPLTQMGFYLLLNSTVNTDWETTSGVQVVKNDGTVEWLTSGGPTGTVGSITGTTATLSSSSGAWVNGEDVTTGNKTTTGTVGSIADTTATLSNSSGSWANGLDVVGPQKTIVEENARLYCAFDSNGNVTDLQNNPQDPPYTTQDSNPGLTLTFPATFPSGLTPDEELPEGTTLTVDVSAANDSGTSGPVSATVQPAPVPPDAPLAGLTTLYTGVVTNNFIANGIDNLNNGGLLWIKNRDNTRNNVLFDTERTANSVLVSNDTGARLLIDPPIVWNDNGFTLPPGDGDFNSPSFGNYVAWNFGKAEGYFDIVKYTGTGSPQQISHSLNTKPGMIICKGIDSVDSWAVQHSALGAAYRGRLDNSAQFDETIQYWNDTEPTSTEFTVGIDPATNNAGSTFIAYLFAEDTPDVIKCGSYIGNDSTTGPIITTGFTPQWVLIKRAVGGNESGSWSIFDSKRGFSTGLGVSDGKLLYANAPNSEVNDKTIVPLADGFQIADNGGTINDGGSTMLYVAIAAPPDTVSMTTAQLAETKLKFATFENRSMVKCGNDAEAARDALIQELALQGYSLPDILELL